MNGSGKDGEGLGSCTKKARVEPYKWTAEEEVAMVCKFEPDNFSNTSYVLPWNRLPDELAVAMTQMRQSTPGRVATLTVDLRDGGTENNDVLFEKLTKGDLSCDPDHDDGDDDDDDELDEDDKQAVEKAVKKWVTSELSVWTKSPTAAVRICGVCHLVIGD